MENQLPGTLYVFMEDDGDGSYFPVSHAELEGIDDGVVVGVYELKETKTVAVVTTLQ